MTTPYNPYLANPYFNYQAQPPMMPVIQTNIVQVSDVSEVEKFQVANGQSQMFMSKDDNTIYIKSATNNGSTIDVYEKRPAPKAPEYVTMDQLENIFKKYGVVPQEVEA